MDSTEIYNKIGNGIMNKELVLAEVLNLIVKYGDARIKESKK